MKPKKVVILYRYVPEYRAAFYTKLHALAAARNIDLKIVYGDPDAAYAARNDAVDIPCGVYRKHRNISLPGLQLLWQPALDLVEDADLVIVEQANKLLINYLLMWRQLTAGKRLAFWGHGKNFMARWWNAPSEILRDWLTRIPYWWFAYTESTAEIVISLGVPAERVTVVDNAVDTQALTEWREQTTWEELAATRKALGLRGDNVCIHAGSLYKEKRIAFLLESCSKLREKIPDFELIIMGSGVEADTVKAFSEKNAWAKYVGPVFGHDKVKYFLLSKLLLMPGAVGLAVLDAFALGVPMVTTSVTTHGPEISYLKDGKNGVCVDPSDDSNFFAARVADLLRNEPARLALARACLEAAKYYTIDNMATRFCEGIARAVA